MLDSLPDLDHLPRKGLGADLPRTRYQRPRVRRRGARGRDYWYAEYRERTVVDGVEKRLHKTKEFGLCKTTTREEAQTACDDFMRGINGAPSRPDASMSVARFWTEIYFPARSGHWAYNTRMGIASSWRCHLEPVLGSMRLDEVYKHHIERALIAAAQRGAGQELLDRLRFMCHDLFEEACDNEFLTRNPARKVKAPKGKPSSPPRSLTEEEVTRLLTNTHGEERLMWAVMVLTGVRPGEMLALTRSSVRPAGLWIEHSALNRKFAPTKNRKSRLLPLPAQLREELEAHIASLPARQDLLFPDEYGRMRQRCEEATMEILARGRAASGAPDLTWRMCRTTLGTLIDADPSDIQAILGHATAEFTVARYRRSRQERAQSAMDELAAKVVPIKRRA